MSAISNLLNQIKTAIYGEQVRGSIHDAIEQCYEDVTNAKTLADNSINNSTAALNNANDAVNRANAAQRTADNAIADVTAARDTTVQAKDDAVAAKNDSVAAKEAAIEARNNVELLAEQVSNDKSEVAGFKQDASDSAANAANSETLAAGSAQTADDIRVAIEEMFQTMEMEIPERIKTALLNCFQHLAWVDADGKIYYDALAAALEPPVVDSIVAVFDQGDHKVYTVDTLDSLRKYLDVKALYTNGKQAYTRGYTLSGNLTAGSSRISVAYSGKSTSFAVSVTAMTVRSISCVYQQSGIVFDSDDLDVLRKDLTVTAYFNNGSTQVLDDLNYSLSGNLSAGTSTITVTYGGKKATFTVAVTDTSVTVDSISCVYTQSGTVLDTDSLDVLKADLVVTAHYSNSTEQVIDALNYELSGTLSKGTSVITVSYAGKTATFSVTVSADPTSNVVYELTTPKTFSGNDSSEVIDTGLQVGKANTEWAIFFEFTLTTLSGWQFPLHAMHEETPYPGYALAIEDGPTLRWGDKKTTVKYTANNIGANNVYRFAYSTTNDFASTIARLSLNGVEIQPYESSPNGLESVAVNEALAIGGHRPLSGPFDGLWKGTARYVKILNRAASNSEITDFLTSEINS